nr:tetratricopeptide repeat protein [Paraburkholderia phenoliruptrix]
MFAEACFHRSLTLAGDTATLHRNLADCLRQSARLAEARYHYTRALEIEPQLLHAVRALALISAENSITTRLVR